MSREGLRPVFSFDLETVGLYGNFLAVGVSVQQKQEDGSVKELESLCLRTDDVDIEDPKINALPEDVEYVKKNILPAIENEQTVSSRTMRDRFWDLLQQWIEKGCDVVVDCGTPVEAGFLRACVLDDLPGRKWKSPYPCHELATRLLGAGLDPVGYYERLPNELPLHNPLCDARQTARLWITKGRVSV